MSSIDTLWEELVTSALLGTDRHPPALPVSNGALAQLLGELDPSNPQRLLLEAAAVVSLYRQAGSLPTACVDSSLSPCDPDEQARCSPAAAARLAALLGGQYKELVPEWLSLAAAARKRTPEELLPELLEWGDNHLDQIDLLLPVLGKRGRWLAAQIPWGQNIAAAVYAESVPPESVNSAWQTGRKANRRLLLRRLRKSDPALALKLVPSTWSEESAEDRAAFLAYFEAGLSMADEPFLEAALDDRSKEVRKAAAVLLARLPASRWVDRQLQRARSCLDWKPGGLLRKPRLEITLPEACDKGMIRDGIELKPHIRETFGEKGWWLQQVLRGIPPSIWCRLWNQTPVELLETAGQGDWKELVHTAWILATLNHPDPEWAEALLKQYPRNAVLLDILPFQQREVFLSSQFRSQPNDAIDTLIGYHHTWSVASSRQVLRHLRRYIDTLEFNRSPIALKQIFHYLSLYLHPALVSEAQEDLVAKTDQDSHWERAVENLLQILDFRQRMVEELR